MAAQCNVVLGFGSWNTKRTSVEKLVKSKEILEFR